MAMHRGPNFGNLGQHVLASNFTRPVPGIEAIRLACRDRQCRLLFNRRGLGRHWYRHRRVAGICFPNNTAYAFCIHPSRAGLDPRYHFVLHALHRYGNPCVQHTCIQSKQNPFARAFEFDLRDADSL
jgi:hypothetical protein